MVQTKRKKGISLPSISARGLKITSAVLLVLGTIGMLWLQVISSKIDWPNLKTQQDLTDFVKNNSSLMGQLSAAVIFHFVSKMAVPIFALLTVEGYLKARSRKIYLISIWALALISEIPFDVAFSKNGTAFDLACQNPVFSIAVCILLIHIIKKSNDYDGVTAVVMKIFVISVAMLLCDLLRFQYGITLVALCSIFYIFKNKQGWKMGLGIVAVLLCAYVDLSPYFFSDTEQTKVMQMLSVYGAVVDLLAFYFVFSYDNKPRELKLPKYVFYALYPAHLLIFGLVTRLWLI